MPNAQLGMLIFVTTEIMFFIALVSSYLVIKSRTGNWVPPGDLTLPVVATAFNSVILFLSGILCFVAHKKLKERNPAWRRLFLRAIILGGFFVLFQGMEWVKLIEYGMTMTSGVFGACFFLLIGSHGLHAASAIIAMTYYYFKSRRRDLPLSTLTALTIFWFFVVGIWPVLYGLVYF